MCDISTCIFRDVLMIFSDQIDAEKRTITLVETVFQVLASIMEYTNIEANKSYLAKAFSYVIASYDFYCQCLLSGMGLRLE